jgi:uncharacterized protein
MASPDDPIPPIAPVPPAAAQRGFRHWTIIGVVVAVLIVVFLLRR